MYRIIVLRRRADWHDECQHEREHYILADKAFYCTSQARVYFCH
jgi:hypothetical protein